MSYKMKPTSYQNATVHLADGSNDGVYENSSVIKNNRRKIFKTILAIMVASGVAYLAATPHIVRSNFANIEFPFGLYS